MKDYCSLLQLAKECPGLQVSHAVGADVRAHTEQLITHPVKLGDGLIVPDEPGVNICFCVS